MPTGNTLYIYQVKKVIEYLICIGEIENGGNKNELDNEI